MTARRGVPVAGRLAVARALSRVPAALLPLLVAALFGATRETDTFFIVYAGVLFTSGTFGFLETAVVPFVPGTKPIAVRARFAGVLLARVLVVLSPLALVLAIGGVVWRSTSADALPAGHDGWRHLLILSPLPLLSGAGALLTGYLNAGERYLISAAAAAVKGTLALAVAAALASSMGLPAFSVGILAGEVVAFVWLVGASGIRPGSRIGPEAVELGRFRVLARSMFVAALANSSRGFVDRVIAAALGPGAVSILEYAERVFHMTVAVIGAPIATVHLSRWAARFHDASPASTAGLGRAVARARAAPFLLGLGMLALVAGLLFTPLVAGWLDHVLGSDRGLFQWTLIAYLAGAVPYLLNLVVSQALLVLRDARFVLVATVSIAAANVPLDLIGRGLIGLPGIAVASSLLATASWLAAEYRIRRHVHRTAELCNNGEAPRP